MRFEKTGIAKFYSNVIKLFIILYRPYYFFVNKDSKYIKKDFDNIRFSRKNISATIKELKKIRYQNIINIIFYNPSNLFSFMITLVTLLTSAIVLIPIVILNRNSISNGEWSIFWRENYKLLISSFFAFTLASLIFFISPIYLYKQIAKMSNSDFAKFIKNSLSESEMLTFISYRIWCLCYDTESWCYFLVAQESPKLVGCNKKDDGLLYYANDEEFYTNYNRSNASKYLRNLCPPKLTKRYRRQRNNLDFKLKFIEHETTRINHLISEYSNKTSIPEIELTEHIFQFSPSMHLRYYRKMLSNLKDISFIEKNFDKDEKEKGNYILYKRQTQLSNEIYRFIERQKKFKRFQSQNIFFSQYHRFILEMASSASTTEALKCYLKLLNLVSCEWIDAAYNSDKSIMSNQFSKLAPQFKEKFCYVFFKRFSHGGIDLHYSLTKFVSRYENNLKLDSMDIEHMLSVENFKSIITDTSSYYLQIKDVEFLRNLLGNYKRYIELSRIKIANNLLKYKLSYKQVEITFGHLLQEWGKIEDNIDMYIITFGFSKIIREVLKNSNFSTAINNLQRRDKSNNNTTVVNKVVFFSEKEADLDARLIKYSLTEEKRKKIENIIVSNPEFIIPLLNENSRVLILMGCEAADKKNRVIRTYNYKKAYIDFINESRKRIVRNNHLYKEDGDIVKQNNKEVFFNERFKTIVICESFKLHEDLAKIHLYFDDQYEEIEMYGPEYITAIITELDF